MVGGTVENSETSGSLESSLNPHIVLPQAAAMTLRRTLHSTEVLIQDCICVDERREFLSPSFSLTVTIQHIQAPNLLVRNSESNRR